MSLLDRILNRQPEMKELYVMETPKYGTFGQEDKPRVTFEALAGIKNKVDNALNKGGNFLEEALFGEVVKPAPTQVKTNADGNTIVETAINNDARQGGIIPDLMTGFKENLGEKFSTSNLTDTKDKGFIYRLGEGLGTATRLLDSPLGRGLAVAGAVGALGGSGGDALAYGLNTTAQNQGLRMQDKIYRNDLANMDVDTSGINGYITEDMYKNILASRQMQDNAEWRKANLLAQQEQNDALNAYRQANIAQGWAQIEANKNKVDKKELARAKQASSTVNMINKALETVKDNPDAFGFSKGVLPSDAVDRLDPKGTEARAIINSVTAEYRKYLTGAQMSDKERQYYEKFLPNPRDNAKITTQKLNGMLMVISAREGLNTEEVGTITTNNAQPKTNDLPATPKKIGKYTVEVQ